MTETAVKEPMRILVVGATGTIGRATVRALCTAGHRVVCLARNDADVAGLEPATVVRGDVTAGDAVADCLAEPTDAVVSCLGSRTGIPADAWAIDHDANLNVLNSARAAGVGHFVYLSAICVQKPILAFQHAKLAFENELIASGISYSIVRPTAFFKSLSGQIERVRSGRPFLVFGSGEMTACKPISDADLGRFMADCVRLPQRRNKILPIGGPGPAITPLEQADHLFGLLNREPRIRRVPVVLMDAIIGALSLGARVSPKLGQKAELARIGRYYGTESMLVWDVTRQRYDAGATPSFGSDTLVDHYRDVLEGRKAIGLGDHAVF